MYDVWWFVWYWIVWYRCDKYYSDINLRFEKFLLGDRWRRRRDLIVRDLFLMCCFVGKILLGCLGWCICYYFFGCFLMWMILKFFEIFFSFRSLFLWRWAVTRAFFALILIMFLFVYLFLLDLLFIVFCVLIFVLWLNLFYMLLLCLCWFFRCRLSRLIFILSSRRLAIFLLIFLLFLLLFVLDYFWCMSSIVYIFCFLWIVVCCCCMLCWVSTASRFDLFFASRWCF